MNAADVSPTRDATSLLDRQIPLGSWLLTAAPWLGLLLVMLGTRLYGLRTYPLDPHEASLAANAVAVVSGGDLSATDWAQPVPTLLAALSFFLFGPGDGAARLPSILASLALVPALALLARTLGRDTALAGAVLLTLSPTVALAGTRLDGAIVLVLLASLAAAALVREPSVSGAVLLGALLAALPLSDPLGWIVAPAMLVLALVRFRGNGRSLALLGTSALVTLALVSTVLFTRPSGLATFLGASWSALWHDHLAALGHRWTFPAIVLATDEVPNLIAAVTGAVVLVRERHVRWPIGLGLLVLLLVMLFGNGTRTALVLVAVATGVLGAYGLSAVMAHIRWSALLDRWNAAVLGMLALVVFIGLSLLGRLLDGPNDSLLAWSTGLVSLLLLFAVAFWVLRTLWPRASAAWTTPVVLVSLALFALAVRNTMLVNATTSYRPGTILHAGDASPGLVKVVERIRRASTDLTMFQFDPRDPTGGHGLVIVADRAVAQPFAWYLRDFPNMTIVESGGLASAVPAAQVVIAAPTVQAAVAALRPDLIWQPVPYRLEAPASLARPDWPRLAVGLVDPRAWREYVSFLLYRRVSRPTQPESVLVGLAPDVAALAGYPAVP